MVQLAFSFNGNTYNIRFIQHEMLNMLLLPPNLDGFVREAAKKLFS